MHYRSVTSRRDVNPSYAYTRPPESRNSICAGCSGGVYVASGSPLHGPRVGEAFGLMTGSVSNDSLPTGLRRKGLLQRDYPTQHPRNGAYRGNFRSASQVF